MYGGCLLCPLYPLLLLFIWESVWATENCCVYVIRKRVVDIFFWENRSQETEKSKLRYHYTISVVYLFLTLFINQSDIVKFINQRSCWRGKKSLFVSSLLVENVSHLSYTPPLKEQWAPNSGRAAISISTRAPFPRVLCACDTLSRSLFFLCGCFLY